MTFYFRKAILPIQHWDERNDQVKNDYISADLIQSHLFLVMCRTPYIKQ